MSKVVSGVMGLVVGDALGVPVEFYSREALDSAPVTGMRANGTHNQPIGTWSDDSSMTLCTIESLIEAGLDTKNLAKWFVDWRMKRVWTPHGEVFDIGTGTALAISMMSMGIKPTECGNAGINNNGNGALMRILPLVYILKKQQNVSDRMRWVEKYTSVTHGHIISKVANSIYVEIGIKLLDGMNIQQAYEEICKRYANGYRNILKEFSGEFERILSGSLESLKREEIKSSGYVVDTLEASIWCLLNSSSYSEAILKAVNLGEDTDTTGAVTGGLAGIIYGYESIPKEWVEKIVKKEEIISLCKRLK